ncbi:Nucleotide-diphospho-sugar transferase [Cinnamomum micranthum f. kanehirae]|uniref:Nucleotide-diphospho-sugar transferase n=1 Tax=Cinnamomum micranthum f. kanehirae TaxID=337451 RepID=A0A443P7K2_9MAGN|nr:Nucleotide-diphospho-sugar transferase [Cinnamomum micranthum f. kanehirae]
MDSSKIHVGFWFGLASLMVLDLLSSGVWNRPVWTSVSSFPRQNKTSTIPKDELEEALEGASMENKTLIIGVVNKAYTKEGSMLDLFLQSFQLGEGTQFLRNHLLLIAVDQTAFDRCNLKRLHCCKLKTDGVDFSGEKVYMSNDFLKMMWSRTLFLTEVLRRGYNFIFTDMDVMWLRNPFERLSHELGEDLQISCDFYNGQPLDWTNPINTGFYFVASNKKTIALFDTWYASKNESEGMKEQDVLGRLIREGVIQQLDLRVRFLDTLYFGGFCSSGKDYGKVVTIHANCCVTIKPKIRDLRAVLDGWIKFRGRSDGTSTGKSNSTSTVLWPSYEGCFGIKPNSTSTSNQTSTPSNQTLL